MPEGRQGNGKTNTPRRPGNEEEEEEEERQNGLPEAMRRLSLSRGKANEQAVAPLILIATREVLRQTTIIRLSNFIIG